MNEKIWSIANSHKPNHFAAKYISTSCKQFIMDTSIMDEHAVL